MQSSNDSNATIWPIDFSRKAMLTIVVTIIVLNISFIEYHTPPMVLVLILFTALFFFFLLNRLSHEWSNLSFEKYLQKLFIFGLLFRIIFFILMYFYTYWYFPQYLPFEYEAADAYNYYASAKELTGNILNNEFLRLLDTYWRSIADHGYPFFLGLINSFLFESIFVQKFVNIVMGAHTVVLVTRIANINYGEKNARFSGLILMLLPSLMWNNSMLLKETLMIYLITISFYNLTIMVRKNRFNIIRSLIVVASVSAFFYLRTAMVVVLGFSAMIYLFLNMSGRKSNTLVPITLVVIFIFGIVYMGEYTGEIEEISREYENLSYVNEQVLGSKINAVGNINLTTQLASPLLFLNSLVTPYPSILNIDSRQLGIILHAHNEFVRIILMYFCIVGIFIAIKRDYRNSSLLLSFSLGYTLLVAIVGKSYEDRFQLPAVPFLMMFVPIGLINMKKSIRNGWNWYLFFVVIAVISWHILKIYIRGYLNW